MKIEVSITNLRHIFYIYKEECLSVCLFAMHSVPVIATITKLSRDLLQT